MPMPEPKDGESKDEFMDRCMGDDVMNEDYPDEKQRYAVCLSQWGEDKDTLRTENIYRDCHGSPSRFAPLIRDRIDGETRNDNRGLMPFEFDELEVRADAVKQKLIRGHGVVYNKLSEDMGGFKEVFDPGSLADTIKKDDIRSLRDHNSTYILGRTKAGTLALTEDEKGIYYEVTPPDTSYARDLLVSIERRDVTGGSIIFQVDGKKGEKWYVDGAEVPMMDAFMAMWDGKKHDIVRHVVKARLWDIGPVTFPAYPQTDVKVRSLMEAAREKIEITAKDKLVAEGALNRRAVELARERLRFK